MIKSTPKQRQLIGYFRKTLRLEDDIYREILASYHVESSKDLIYEDAQKLLNSLRDKAIGLGLYTPKEQYTKYENMSGRYKMGTPKQLRKIEAMWYDVSVQKDALSRQKALNSFIERITGKKRVNFLVQSEISKVIKALEVMKGKKYANE